MEVTQKTKNSLAVQWLGLHTFTANGLGSIPGQGTKTPQVTQHGQKIKKKTLKIELPYNPAIQLLGIYIWKKQKY